jgi:iron(III) transport system permease protein
VFLNAAGQFGIPAVIGIPTHYEVITTRIWVGLGYFPPKYTEAAAFAVVLLAFSSIIVFIQHRMLANKSYATVTGKGSNLPWRRSAACATSLSRSASSISR